MGAGAGCGPTDGPGPAANGFLSVAGRWNCRHGRRQICGDGGTASRRRRAAAARDKWKVALKYYHVFTCASNAQIVYYCSILFLLILLSRFSLFKSALKAEPSLVTNLSAARTSLGLESVPAFSHKSPRVPVAFYAASPATSERGNRLMPAAPARPRGGGACAADSVALARGLVAVSCLTCA